MSCDAIHWGKKGIIVVYARHSDCRIHLDLTVAHDPDLRLCKAMAVQSAAFAVIGDRSDDVGTANGALRMVEMGLLRYEMQPMLRLERSRGPCPEIRVGMQTLVSFAMG